MALSEAQHYIFFEGQPSLGCASAWLVHLVCCLEVCEKRKPDVVQTRGRGVAHWGLGLFCGRALMLLLSPHASVHSRAHHYTIS